MVRDILDSGDTGPAAYVAHHAERVELFLDAQAKAGKCLLRCTALQNAYDGE